MKIYDISQEIFSCSVYPGDPIPKKEIISEIKDDSGYNLSSFSMCTHNGTHIDAPYHFDNRGKTVEQIPLEKFVGKALVVEHQGLLEAKDINEILRVINDNSKNITKLLIKGSIEMSLEAADIIANSNLELVGTEMDNFGNEETYERIHKCLLSKEIVLLEGVRLDDIEEGEYFLSSAPLNLGSCDGAPCRAILIKF